MDSTKAPNISNLQDYVRSVLSERGFDDETVLEKCLLLGEEVGELFKAIRKTQEMKCDDNSKFSKVEHELADVLMYVMDIANKCGIDMENAFIEKENINKERIWK